MSENVFIVAAVRTPLGSFGGSLKSFSATQLGALAIEGAIKQSGIDKNAIEDVLMGSVLQANLGQAPARQAAKFAGLSDNVNCTTVNKVCASGMKTITLATQSIRLNDASVVVAGGMESMTNAPFYDADVRWGHKYGNYSMVDAIAKDGLVDVYDGVAMGLVSEATAEKYIISREAQDAYATLSYQRSQEASGDGSLQTQIVPLTVQDKKAGAITVDKDEEPFNVKFDKIPTLKPAFKTDGTITAANASTMNDGAAALILCSESQLTNLNLKPLAKVISYADDEQAPVDFTTSPALAINKALQKAGMKIDDVDYFEINEAFSVVVLANQQILGIDTKKLNVKGGAVSMGHPLGASGARIVVSLLHILKQNNAKYGAAAICNGGGGATAIIIENIS